MPLFRKPNRPDHAISQSFNDGIVSICTVTDAAQPGHQPVKKLQTRLKLRFDERSLGITRYYAAKQANISISRVIRVPRGPEISTDDVAITHDGQQFSISLIQAVQDVYPPCLDLTLSVITQQMEVDL